MEGQVYRKRLHSVERSHGSCLKGSRSGSDMEGKAIWSCVYCPLQKGSVIDLAKEVPAQIGAVWSGSMALGQG